MTTCNIYTEKTLKFYCITAVILFFFIPSLHAQESFPTQSMQHFFIERTTLNKRTSHLDYTTDYELIAYQVVNSGKISNDPKINDLVQRILKGLEPKNSTSIFVVESNQIGTFSVNNSVYLTTGLLAKSSSPDQLAFVINRELERLKTYSFPIVKVQRAISYEEKLKIVCRNSLETNLKLDSLSLLSFLSSGFSTFAAMNGIELFAQQYGSFSEHEIPIDYLNVGNFVIPPFVYTTIKAESDIRTIDKSSTVKILEKTVDKRKVRLKIVSKDKPPGQTKLITFLELYAKVVSECKQRYAWQALKNGHYDDCIYSTFQLEQRQRSSFELDLLKANAWYGLAMTKLGWFKSQPKPYFQSINGNSARFFSFIANLAPEAIASIALRQIFDLKQKHPNNPQIDRIWSDFVRRLSMSDLFVVHDIYRRPIGVNQIDRNNENFYQFGLDDIINDEGFQSLFYGERAVHQIDPDKKVVIYPCVSLLKGRWLIKDKTNKRKKLLKEELTNSTYAFKVEDFSSLSYGQQAGIKQLYSQLFISGDYHYTVPLICMDSVLSIIPEDADYAAFPFFQGTFRPKVKSYHLFAFFGVTIPFLLPDFLLKSYQSQYAILIIDKKSGMVVKSEYSDFHAPLTYRVMTNRIYNSIYSDYDEVYQR